MGIYGINILNEILINRWVMLGFIVFYGGFAVADIFRRHLLSKGAVYYVTMLLAPASLYSSVAAPTWGIMQYDEGWKIVLHVAAGIILFVLTAVVYIRGHIFPTEKNLNYNGQEKLVGAKRLIIIGIPSTIIYFAFSIVQLVIAINWLMDLGDGPIEVVKNLGVMLVGLLIPLINIIIIIMFILIGTQFVIWAAMLFMAFMQCLLISNGCIRYILTENKSKAQKALFIFLAIIPGVNFILGIRYLIIISNILKTEKKGV